MVLNYEVNYELDSSMIQNYIEEIEQSFISYKERESVIICKGVLQEMIKNEKILKMEDYNRIFNNDMKN